MATACKIYCGKYFIDWEKNQYVPSCLCSALKMEPTNIYNDIIENDARSIRDAIKSFHRSFKMNFHNKRYKTKDDMLYEDRLTYEDWVEDLKKHIEIHEKVAQEHNPDKEYCPSEMEYPSNLIIPLDHYIKT